MTEGGLLVTAARWCVFVLLACAAGVSAAGEPASASSTGTLTFVVRVDENLVGARYLLTTTSGADQLETVLLRTGFVTGADQPLAISVPVAEAQRSTSNHFAIRLTKALDSSHALVATAIVGLLRDRVSSGGTVDLGTRTGRLTRTYATAEAALAASSCGSSCAAPRSTLRRPGSSLAQGAFGTPAPKPFRASAPVLEGRAATRAGSAESATQDLGVQPPPPTPPPIECGSAPFGPCGGPPVSSAERDCDPIGFLGLGGQDCVVDAYEIRGVLAFRGNSYRPVGARSTFSVKEESVQRWDVGVRIAAGPFSVGGQTESEVAEGSTTTWPLRGDCWLPARPNDGPTCDPWGVVWAYGRDTWLWEKHLIVTCPFPFVGACIFDTEERLRQYTYDGGAEDDWDEARFDLGWFEPPGDIMGDVRGHWARYAPGTLIERWAEEKVTESAGAAIAITLPESLGGATFESSVENQTLDRVTNTHQIRPTSELPFLGWVYRYDWNYSPWKYEFWSCETAPGHPGGTCWS
jgi:hypothetical protein